MIEISNIKVYNMDGAFRGLRNPMNSWERSDSINVYNNDEGGIDDILETVINKYIGIFEDFDGNQEQYKQKQEKFKKWLIDQNKNTAPEFFLLGPNDRELAHRMINAGADERKFLRQIFVSFDIESPLYWWKEMDQYKVATTTNSCSTMHKLTSAPITKDSFSFDKDLEKIVTFESNEEVYNINDIYESIIEQCELLRLKYLETKDKPYWRALIQILPCGWNQKRTWTANYEVLRNIYFARRNHKLTEWNEFCKFIETLPYARDLITYSKESF